ncbi:MAG: hypothetical protein ACOZJZ_05890 [Pseudomonadota bacterium]
MQAMLWGCGALLLVGGWAWVSSPEAPSPAPPQPERAAQRLPAPPLAPAQALAGAPLPAAQFVRWLDQQSSLRGAELDGSWDVDGQGRFHPTVALRRRFDQLLTLAGETRLERITAFIEHDVRELVGADGALAVLDAWQRYLELQRYAWRTGVQGTDRAALAAALAERQQVRRRILGPALAQAFFADDEAQLQDLIRSPAAPPEAQTTAIDRNKLEPDALARLQAEEAAWADWQRRLDAARREIEALRAAPHLSAAQRDDAIARLIAQRFDAREAVRVRALLHLAPASS